MTRSSSGNRQGGRAIRATERAPRTAAKSLQTYVSQLRRAPGDDAIATRPRGYLLPVGRVPATRAVLRVLLVLRCAVPTKATWSSARVPRARHCAGKALGADGVRVRGAWIEPPREGDQVGVVPGVLDAYGTAPCADAGAVSGVADQGFQVERKPV